MRNNLAIRDLLALLAQLYAMEGRDGGDETAAALRTVLMNFPGVLPEPNCTSLAVAELALTHRPHPQAGIVAVALPLIRWLDVTEHLGPIGLEMGRQMLVCELVGPDGMVFHERVRVGLFVQFPHLLYSTRTHSAEETYVILGGEGFWSSAGGQPALKKAGDIVFHPSWAPHRSETRHLPTIAAWRWSGDIRYESYARAG